MPHNTQHKKRTKLYHLHQRSPFTTSGRSIANERHPTRNEDNIIIDELGGLFAVFDGVGGSAAAEIASQTASHSTRRAWKRILTKERNRRKIYTFLEDCNQHDLCKVLEDLILEADEQVRTNGATRAHTDDLATTVALAAFCRQPDIHDYTMVYAHVGDSRIYLLRGEERIQRLTHDDGLLSKLIENQIVNEYHAFRIDQAMRADQLSDVEYNYFRLRGGITQALGGPIPPTIHTNKISVYPGDRILLCTDGIHDNLTDEEIEHVIRTNPRSSAARVLVESARERSHEDRSQTIRSKPDDMSAIVMTCRF
ncbi:PP2C family protein-serine/threonine phosphatase [Dictyobacter arantiisoli]|uniref:Serine/threonine phosphatase n=1 Tax=Dictyobacter arantiisoli TaxID=2014874 RepID=A0A5A5T8V4_9CHLR|nr:PP2C family serine/threonine-protein phosphatase [Dictyobacter arantiisoli]GCF07695.1 serine/threonine phosphatase [Dictyobacter arantiisoli]